MPYFAWQGVDLAGAHKKGKSCVRSVKELDIYLLQRNIALLKSKPTSKPLLTAKVTAQDIITFFKQLESLLETGVRLPQALELLAVQSHGGLQEALYVIADDVHKGILFSTALSKHAHIFSQLMIQMIQVGQDSGSLHAALNMLCVHLQAVYEFKKKVRAAAVMPLMTLSFFCLIAAGIFFVVVPRFAGIFSAVGKDLPPLTAMLVRMSNAVSSWPVMIGLLSGVLGMILFCRYVHRHAHMRYIIDRTVLKTPFVGPLVCKSAVLGFLQSLAMLLESGMPLVMALDKAQTVVGNSVIRAHIIQLIQDVESGRSLSHAMSAHESMFSPSLIATVNIAEEAGKLSTMLWRAALEYNYEVQKSLHIFVSFFQPVLMIILGLLISLLICAVYLPIFSLSHALS